MIHQKNSDTIGNRYVNLNRKIENTATDRWGGYIDSLPHEPIIEELTMKQMDEFIGTQIPLPTKKGPAFIKTVSRTRDSSGALIGTNHEEPTLDSHLYNIKFPDGHYKHHVAIILAEI